MKQPGPVPRATAADYDVAWSEVYGALQDVGPAHRHMRRIAAQLLAGLEYRSVLEVGCGAGHNLPLLCTGRSLDSVAGVDISQEALMRARQRWPEGRFQRLDIERESLPQVWDLVFSALVLEHLHEDTAALEHMRAMTGKYLLVTTVAGDFERYRRWETQVGHVRNYVPGELEAKLDGAGFEVLKVVRWGFPFYSPLARRLQNRMPAESSYGRPMRLTAKLMHLLYFLNARRRGDLLIVLARV